MNTFGQNNTKPKNKKQAANPFAKALAEMEGRPTGAKKPSESNILSDTLAKTGGSAFDNKLGGLDNKNLLANQEKDLKEKQKKEALRKKLHDQVNPVDQIKVFDAREKQVKKEIDKLREELQFLIKDVAKFHKEVEVTLMTEVVSPGQDGKYYINFFRQLRSFIMLLRQRIKSARTWSRQMHAKSKKKKKQKGPRMPGSARETKAVHDMMHHERSNAFSGG